MVPNRFNKIYIPRPKLSGNPLCIPIFEEAYII